MQFKEGMGWKACYDETTGRYTAEMGGCGSYHLYELTKEQFDLLEDGLTEHDVIDIIGEGRHLYMDINDRCGPPYTVVFDDDYTELCSWASIVSSGKVWPKALTDAAVELFASEKPNREYRKRKKQLKAIRETTVEFYSRFVCTDIPKLKDGVHFVCSAERDEAVKGFGCRYGVYILVKDALCVAAYSPRHEALFEGLKGLSAEEIIEEVRKEHRLRELKLFIFAGEKADDFGAARLLEPADYPLYEEFFRATNPGSDPEGWLRDYFTEKAEKGLFAGAFAGGRLVSVCDAPDVPYMEDRVQHTGIMTRAEHRGKGYGKAAAALSTHHLIESGICPQWECEAENAASAALAKSIGYEEYAAAYILEEPLNHSMKLWHDSFVKIQEGTKTIEMRLYDGKRSEISIGDTITFEDTENGDMLECSVIGLHRYPDFGELYAHHDKISIGYAENETADPADMLRYYSEDDIRRCGVVGIEIKIDGTVDRTEER